jgi:endonuclease/exonuclease/phosphatase family metal-dependent hydrolase
VGLLVRSWNLFHGNAVPPERHAYLEVMVRLISEDDPDLVCLQEVPLWALPRVAEWSGMAAFPTPAAPARLGPFPSTPSLGRALTALHHGLLRSAFTGQGNAILARGAFRPLEQRTLVLNDRRFRRAQARWLSLGVGARLAWGKERRVCQAVRFRLEDGSTLLIANLHATAYPADRRLADAELLRAAVFADGLAAVGERLVLAGDFNVRAPTSRTLADLTGGEWGFAAYSHGVDHVLVRGAPLEAGYTWPPERRRRAGRLLSDHAPIEARLG